MIHHTINTGHWRMSPRSEVDDQIIAALEPLLFTGHHEMPVYDDLLLQLTIAEHGAVFTILCKHKPKPVPLIHGGMAWTVPERATMESKLNQICAAVGARVVPDHQLPGPCPPGVPYLGVILFDTISLLGERIADIADFERCLAWALYEDTLENT